MDQKEFVGRYLLIWGMMSRGTMGDIHQGLMMADQLAADIQEAGDPPKEQVKLIASLVNRGMDRMASILTEMNRRISEEEKPRHYGDLDRFLLRFADGGDPTELVYKFLPDSCKKC